MNAQLAKHSTQAAHFAGSFGSRICNHAAGRRQTRVLAMSLKAKVDMHEKTVLITGSTDGIGKHTAQRLAQDGATVLVHGRNAQKAQAAAESIRKATGNENVHAFAADLSSHKQVRRLGQEVKAAHPQLYALVNNAGIFAERMQKSKDGYELTWAVNVQAPFLLTSILLDSVTKRIVNVSSISANSSIDFDNLNQEKGFSSHNSYGLSKLAMMCFTRDLASIEENRGVTANCLDPGTVNTKMLYAGWGPCGIDLKVLP
jgi:NAD(P)-dependent dehydrogenase (short-subunit alcohol dehydrogenase family)